MVSGKPFQSIYTGDEDIVQTAVFQFSQHIEPELRPFIFGQPHAQQFFLTFDIDAQCREHRFVDDATVLPNFKDDTVKIKQWGKQHPVVGFAILQPAPSRHR